jgi:hypothetical protein
MISELMLVAAVTMAPSPTPSATATHWPCAVPNHEADLVARALPDVPKAAVDRAQTNGAELMAIVRILIGPDR